MEVKKERTYFDHICEKYGFLRDYIHFLDAHDIKIILVVCTPNLPMKEMCRVLNKEPNLYRQITPHLLKAQTSKIRSKLYAMHRHAILFGIEKKIKPASMGKLERIVNDYESNLREQAI